MRGYTVEYKTGKIALNSANLLVKDVTDMEALEFWEDRLKELGEPFVVVYKKIKGKIRYSIYTQLKKKGGAFK
jgi:hypothetical protein